MKPMTNFYVRPEHLPQMEEIARVTAAEPGKRVWTELALYYRNGFTRPFVAVVEGKTTGEQGFVPRFRCMTAGTLDRAINWFDLSNLTNQLTDLIPDDAATRWPSGNGDAAGIVEPIGAVGNPLPLPQVRVVGYPGHAKLLDALAWLYPGVDAPSKLVERDFGMPARTVRHAMSIEAGETKGNPGSWVQTFIAALRYFDRELWEQCNAVALRATDLREEKANG